MSNSAVRDLSGLAARVAGRACVRVEFCNVNPAPARWGLTGRVLETFHVVGATRGAFTYTVEGTAVDVTPGTFVLVGPGVIHSSAADPGRWPHLLTCRFELLPLAGSRPPMRRSERYWQTIRVGDLGPYVAKWERMYRCFLQPHRPDQVLERDATMTSILGDCVREGMDRERARDAGIERARSLIREDPARRIPVDRLAREAGCSRRTFFERFARAVGCTPAVYQIRARCDRARDLLLRTGMSIKEIAHALGYSDQYAFSKQFKANAGVAPSRFRQRS